MWLNDLWRRGRGFHVLPAGAVLVPTYPEAVRIAESIRDYPEDWAWSHRGYKLGHVPSGFEIWVANEKYGLEDVTGGSKTKFDECEKNIIWPAVEAWLARNKVGFTGRLPKVRLHRANGYWWCRATGHPWAGAGATPEQAYRSWSRAVSIQARKDDHPNEILHVWSAER